MQVNNEKRLRQNLNSFSQIEVFYSINLDAERVTRTKVATIKNFLLKEKIKGGAFFATKFMCRE